MPNDYPLLCEDNGAEYVYVLVDSREPSRVRYVGRTRSPGSRFDGHMNDSSPARRVVEWRNEVRAGGGRVQMRALATLVPDDDDREADLEARAAGMEALAIEIYRQRGQADLNTAAPGWIDAWARTFARNVRRRDTSERPGLLRALDEAVERLKENERRYIAAYMAAHFEKCR